jgi:flagellar M-ring protein FliF
VSAAVVVNFKRVEGKPGQPPTSNALSPKELEQITNLSREAMGFSKERGDTLNVVNAAFTGPAEAPPAEPVWEDPEAMLALLGQNLGNLGVAALIAYLVFGVLRPAIRRLSDLAPVMVGEGAAGGEGGVAGARSGGSGTAWHRRRPVGRVRPGAAGRGCRVQLPSAIRRPSSCPRTAS